MQPNKISSDFDSWVNSFDSIWRMKTVLLPFPQWMAHFLPIEWNANQVLQSFLFFQSTKKKENRKRKYQTHFRKFRKMVLCYQNCSDLVWEKNVLVIEKTFEIRGWRLRTCKFFEITWTIYSNSERSELILVTECFLTCSWRFLMSNRLEQSYFKLKKILGFRNMQEKLEKKSF